MELELEHELELELWSWACLLGLGLSELGATRATRATGSAVQYSTEPEGGTPLLYRAVQCSIISIHNPNSRAFRVL